jgi:hypothetical protein
MPLSMYTFKLTQVSLSCELHEWLLKVQSTQKISNLNSTIVTLLHLLKEMDQDKKISLSEEK